MNLMKIVIKNMRQRALATWLTGTSVALGVALAIAIILIKQGVQQRFEQGTVGYEMVVGAKGSPLQLVLNTVYNLDISPGNISWKLFEQLRADRRVKLAVPFSVGDNYHGFRIVGTTDAFFNDFEFEPGRKPELEGGRIFTFSESALKGAFLEAEQRAREREGENAAIMRCQPGDSGKHGHQSSVRSSDRLDGCERNRFANRPDIHCGPWRAAVGRGQRAY